MKSKLTTGTSTKDEPYQNTTRFTAGFPCLYHSYAVNTVTHTMIKLNRIKHYVRQLFGNHAHPIVFIGAPGAGFCRVVPSYGTNWLRLVPIHTDDRGFNYACNTFDIARWVKRNQMKVGYATYTGDTVEYVLFDAKARFRACYTWKGPQTEVPRILPS